MHVRVVILQDFIIMMTICILITQYFTCSRALDTGLWHTWFTCLCVCLSDALFLDTISLCVKMKVPAAKQYL